MAIPDLDHDGFLPEGVHEATMEQIKEQFGRFQRTDRRMALFRKLEELINSVWKTGLVSSVIVNGSFATGEDTPSDIDLVLVLNADHDFTADLQPFQYNVLSKRRVRKMYQFDVLLARDESQEYNEYVAFFQQVKEQPGCRKGVLKVLP